VKDYAAVFFPRIKVIDAAPRWWSARAVAIAGLMAGSTKPRRLEGAGRHRGRSARRHGVEKRFSDARTG